MACWTWRRIIAAPHDDDWSRSGVAGILAPRFAPDDSRMKLRNLLAVAAGLACAGCALIDGRRAGADGVAEGLLEWRDVRTQAQPEKVPPLSYGTARHQVGELRLPPGVDGPFPVLVLIPGPCWDGDSSYLRPLAASLATLGVATWTVDYRAAGKGEAWSDPMLDVARATDHLRTLAQTWPLDLRRVAVAGHGGGGQLALWLAARGRIAEGDALYLRDPLPIRGVIGLAAITDLAAQRVAGDAGCGATLDRLLNGAPEGVASSLSPSALSPLRVPQWLVQGALDHRVAVDGASAYAERARRKGDRVTIGVTSNAGHWEPVVPGSSTWMTLQQAVVAALLQ
jgi:acetyl esterase/lipase